MSISQKRRTFDRDDGAEFLVRCLRCSNDTRHHVIRSVSDFWNDQDIGFQNTLQIIECKGCTFLSVRHDESSSEDGPDYDAMTGERFEVDHGKYYPLRARPEIQDAYLLPHQVRQIYHEVLTAHASGLLLLAQVGLGCLIEAVCEDLQQEGPLRRKVEALVTAHVLRETEAALLHKILDIRNDAAHKLTRIAPKTLTNAVAVVEHLLVSLYLLEARRRDL